MKAKAIKDATILEQVIATDGEELFYDKITKHKINYTVNPNIITILPANVHFVVRLFCYIDNL